MGAQNVNFAHEFFQNWAISSPELCIIGSKFSDRRKIYQQSEIGMRQTSRFSDSAGSCGRWWMDIRGGPIRNVTLYFCPYLRQLLTDFQNSFTGTLCRQFAIIIHLTTLSMCLYTTW